MNESWLIKYLKLSKHKVKTVLQRICVERKKNSWQEGKAGSKNAKIASRNNIEQTFKQGNLQAAWQGVKTMTAINSVRDSKPACVAGTVLPTHCLIHGGSTQY